MRKLEETKCIYLIWNDEIKRVKIGISNHPKKRLESLRHQCGCELDLIYNTKPVEKAIEFEKQLHLIFKDYRHLGEWFNLNHSEPLEMIKSLEGEYTTCQIYILLNKGMNPTQIAYRLDVSRSAIVKNMISKGMKVKDIRHKFDNYITLNEFNKEPLKKEIIIEFKKVIKNTKVTNLNIAEMVRINNEKLKAKKLSRK